MKQGSACQTKSIHVEAISIPPQADLRWLLVLYVDRRHHAGFRMRLDMAMGQPDTGMFGHKADGDAFSWPYQHRVPCKGLDSRFSIAFQYPEKNTVDMHGVQP